MKEPSQADIMAEAGCKWSKTKTDIIGKGTKFERAFPHCETHDYPSSPRVMLCLRGIGLARERLMPAVTVEADA